MCILVGGGGGRALTTTHLLMCVCRVGGGQRSYLLSGGVPALLLTQWGGASAPTHSVGGASAPTYSVGGASAPTHSVCMWCAVHAAKKMKLRDEEGNLSGEHCREGLAAVVSVKMMDPEFEGQTKTRLGNPAIKGIVDSCVGKVGFGV